MMLAFKMSLDATAGGMIRPDPSGVGSKYTLEVKYQPDPSDPDSATVTKSLNINSDVNVPKFNSTGAPKDFKLRFKYENPTRSIAGFARIRGTIGEGKINFTLSRADDTVAAKVAGDITGGPDETQTFVGSGTWTGA
jgi:hypothetical protein